MSNFSIVNHNKSLQLSGWDLGFSVLTGLSGAPYAARHFEMIGTKNASNWGHRLAGFVEYLPLVGGVVLIVEMVVSSLFSSTLANIPWRDVGRGSDFKMMRNAIKAAIEHLGEEKPGYASKSQVMAWEKHAIAPFHNLQFKKHFAEDANKKYRESMEDAHFYREFDQGMVAGIFDGHGGSDVSKYVAREFERRFPGALKSSGRDIRKAFETLIHEIHVEIASTSRWNEQGSTAVISFVDKKTKLVYTATVGDSEANLYRKFMFSLKSIPLSVVRDWMSPKDKERLETAHEVPGIVDQIANKHGKKKVRSKLWKGGVNVARALGDIDHVGTMEKPIVIHKPKITMNKVEPGDTLVLACDGLKDFAEEKEIVSRLAAGGENPAQSLVDLAIEEGSTDNVTVLAIEIT